MQGQIDLQDHGGICMCCSPVSNASINYKTIELSCYIYSIKVSTLFGIVDENQQFWQQQSLVLLCVASV